jgi:hypothetical protein
LLRVTVEHLVKRNIYVFRAMFVLVVLNAANLRIGEGKGLVFVDLHQTALHDIPVQMRVDIEAFLNWLSSGFDSFLA